MGSKPSTTNTSSLAPAEVAEKFFHKFRPSRRYVYEVDKQNKNLQRLTKCRSQEILNGGPGMTRSSTFFRGGCEHCEHFHFLKCCMNRSETADNALCYAEWKIHLEKPSRAAKRKRIAKIPEALAGQFTPKGFPGFSDKNPSKVKRRRAIITKKKKAQKFLDWVGKLKKMCFKRKAKPTKAEFGASKDLKDLERFNLDRIYSPPDVESTPSGGTEGEEWGSGWSGADFIVEIKETASDIDFMSGDGDVDRVNSTVYADRGPKIIVRSEEVFIVALVLLLWVGAIALFFNRWGKIRMLEPYQPKFQQQHRSSCPLVDLDSLHSHPRASISRMSMGMAVPLTIPPCRFGTYNPNIYTKGVPTHSRPRQNSVFVGPQVVMTKPPRKTRSAMDIHSLILDEQPELV